MYRHKRPNKRTLPEIFRDIIKQIELSLFSVVICSTRGGKRTSPPSARKMSHKMAKEGLTKKNEKSMLFCKGRSLCSLPAPPMPLIASSITIMEDVCGMSLRERNQRFLAKANLKPHGISVRLFVLQDSEATMQRGNPACWSKLSFCCCSFSSL